MMQYVTANGSYPPAAVYDASGKPLLSWRVLILPYMGQQPLYDKFHLNEPWDSPNNKPLADTVIVAYQCPSNVNAPGSSLTTYQVIVDPRSMFTGQPAGVPMNDVPDGTSHTVLVVEAANPVPWTKPEDLGFAPMNDPTIGMGSKHPGGFNAVFADGSVHFVKSTPANPLSLEVLQGMVTRNGGERVPASP